MSRLIVTVWIEPSTGRCNFTLIRPAPWIRNWPWSSRSTAIAVGRKSDAVVPPQGTEAWEAGMFASLDPCEECLEGLIQPTEYVLTAGEVRQSKQPCGTHRLQLLCLLVVVDAFTADLPGTASFLQRGVVQVAGFAKLTLQKRNLCSCGVETIFVGPAHLFPFLSLPVFAHHRFAHRTDRTGVIAAAPESRQARAQRSELCAQDVRGKSLQSIDNFCPAPRGIRFHKQVYVIRPDLQGVKRYPQLFRLLPKQSLETPVYRCNQDWTTVLRAPHQVILE